MLMYERLDNLEIVGYSDSDYARCLGILRNPRQVMYSNS
jgi:hypothetical protein